MWKTGEEPEFYIAILEDITFRKRAEESLHFTQFAVDRASDFAFWINPDGSFSYVNDTACKWLGYTRKELLDMSFFDIAPYIKPDKWAYHWEEVKTKKSFIFETNFRSSEGSFFPVEVVVNYTEFEGKAYNCAFVRDITDRKIAEEEKAGMEKQLRQAQKMEAIGTLAGGIAHDFNNILSVILGYTDIARGETPPGSNLAENLDEILQAGLRAKDLVKQILAFSRQAEVDRIQIQPSLLLKEAVKLLRSSIPVTIEIHEDVDSETGIIFVDPTQIHQVVLNLFTNAFHAMEETGGKLGVTLKEVEFSTKDIGTAPGVEPGDFIKLSVTDTGPGIPPEIRDNIFDPYFTTKEKGKGTGMGLAIVHGIVKSYGGFITVESNPGKGSTFSVFLPSVKKQISDEKSELEEIPRGNERVLFIDDEEILVDMGKYMLETLGYDPTVKKDSYEAFEAFRDNPDYFDLVITDQTMPGMTGAELSKKMLEIRPDIPIILCTGYSAIISEAKAKAIGIREFALKPLTIKDVAILIRKVLDKEDEKAAP
jgi:PAS domain S-box-containing protein